MVLCCTTVHGKENRFLFAFFTSGSCKVLLPSFNRFLLFFYVIIVIGIAFLVMYTNSLLDNNSPIDVSKRETCWC